MVIQTSDYDDFKTIVTTLMPTSPTAVFGSSIGGYWSATAIQDQTAVVIQLYTGEPESFETDFPDHIDLTAIFTVS